MKLILLAAGKSSRIFKKININKCLIKIKKKTLLRRLVDQALKSKIDIIDVVTGFKSKNIENELKNCKVNFIKNSKYRTTDMVYSSLLALKNTKTDVVICYTDIIFDYKIFKKFKLKKYKNITLPHLKDWTNVWKKRKKKFFDDAETFIIDNENKVIEIGKKLTKKKLSKTRGQFMGIIYVPKEMIEKVIFFYRKRKKKKIQFTEFINFLISKKLEINTFSYNGLWYEFDDIYDLKSFTK